jgi:hypothetical protein
MGMLRKTKVTKPGREMKAIRMRSTISRGGIEKKVDDGIFHPLSIAHMHDP